MVKKMFHSMCFQTQLGQITNLRFPFPWQSVRCKHFQYQLLFLVAKNRFYFNQAKWKKSNKGYEVAHRISGKAWEPGLAAAAPGTTQTGKNTQPHRWLTLTAVLRGSGSWKRSHNHCRKKSYPCRRRSTTVHEWRRMRPSGLLINT